VKTTREYESRQKEIKVHKDRITELEKSISDAQQRDPEIQVAAKMVLSEVDTLKTRIQPEMDQITMELAQYEKELGAILAQEREKRAAVPTNILERIDKLTHMRGGLAIVPINDDCCGGCGVHLSPQTIQIAKRGLDLLQCDRCSSYIYWEDED
jgi:predicted  nucleic acid-binding Zn-ribbon protein